ncbi:MAG TPA: ImmA/IrrE family metallo-endopeptidase [Methylotenera sp.]|nr:ImmA/IrrE family metallo-endopeptidase [Methylotenera sp.]HPH07988.1 ImmA/IrrE family metallo-endopeptidase [Methylotenera sp.]HPM50029.1 ImmA/IrrE family metallo-endopeptidase [Methylotenera sp.]
MGQNPSTPPAWGIELSKLWVQSSMPFPIKPIEIAYEVSKVRFDDKIAAIKGHNATGIDGMLTKSSKANEWFILYDETVQSKGRINFTIAHEFGHYLLHRDKESNFECSQSKILGYGNQQFIQIEKEANIFASYLLMPIDDFRSQINGNQFTLELLSHCADRYDVSLTACVLKWIQFTEETAIVVLSRDEHILWSYPSNSAKKQNIFFKKGTPLPQQVLSRIANIYETNTTFRYEPGVWHPNLDSIESLIISDKYETELFVIRFPNANLKDFEEESTFDTFDLMSWNK